MTWIKVSERLPEEQTRVLVYEDNYIFLAEWWDCAGDIYWNYEGGRCNPSHWMPLPAMPEVEE
jgi:hypothetical protein